MNRYFAFFFFAFLAVGTSLAQTPPPPPPTASPAPKIAEQLERALQLVADGDATRREDREQAYAKLLEGQRYMWRGERLRSRSGRQENARLAREAFIRAVEFDPKLSEGYTALAELAISGQPQDPDEAIRLASLATRVNPNSFGARRILARLYSFQTRMLTGPFDRPAAENAITEWKHVARLDPRNAEAWAFLSELYERTDRADEAIDALRKWLSSAVPVESRFYQMLTGSPNLAPESASIKLGTLLLKAGRVREAIETLSELVAEEPDNFAAVELLRDAIEGSDAQTSALALQSLAQAVSADPRNLSLVNLLAQVQARTGKLDEATALLNSTANQLMETDRTAAASVYVTLGDILARCDRPTEAITAYESALAARGLDQAMTLSADEREFAESVFEKIITGLKNAGRIVDAKAVVERAGKLFGADDLFADRQMVSLLRDAGERPAALALIRSMRKRVPSDHSFVRLEATLLTETGKVDEAVALVRREMEKAAASPPVTTAPSGARESISIAVPTADAFSNYLFISSLYSQANRGKEAVAAADQAYAVARGSERKQIARLTLATAQQMSRDFKGAEKTLRQLLTEMPGNPIALNNLGYFLLERGERSAEALGLIQQAVKIDPTNPSYLDSLGWAYFKLGKLAEAEKHLKEALRLDSGSGTINEHLGDVYQKQGKTDAARSSWNRAAILLTDPADVTRVKQKLASLK